MSEEKLNKKFLTKGRVSFVLSLLLALSVWFLHNMSQSYSANLNYNVRINTTIQGHDISALSENKIVAKSYATGFYILKQRRKSENGVLLIDLNSKYLHKKEQGVYALATSDLEYVISQSDMDDYGIRDVLSDTLIFNINIPSHKRVPIKLNSTLTFKSQYMLSSEISTNPDSIIVYGDDRYLQEINSVSTRHFKHNSLSEGVVGSVKLVEIPNVRFSQDEIYYDIEVERYVERSREITIDVINLPAGKELHVLPSVASLTYRIPFDRKISDNDLQLFVDYQDFILSSNKQVLVQLRDLSSAIISFDIYPKVVECILID